MKNPRYHLDGVEQTYLDACEKAEKRAKSFRNVAVAAFVGIPLIIFSFMIWPYLARERAIPGAWVTIPAGSFSMGMNQAEIDFGHELCMTHAEDTSKCLSQDEWRGQYGRLIGAELPEFDIMDNEVTNAQYRQCIEAGGCQPPNTWKYNPGDVNKPAASLNWFHATAYCVWLRGRLPSDAEWEKAARGPDSSYFPWGNTWEPTYANLAAGEDGDVATITEFADTDINGYQLKNLAGNVREWTASEGAWFAMDQPFSPPNPLTEIETNGNHYPVIVRGGSSGIEPSEGMASKRGWDSVWSLKTNIGFRCVCPEDQVCESPWTGWWSWFGKY
jgi:formylglycine-generating enzyme required for sulfatase activity